MKTLIICSTLALAVTACEGAANTPDSSAPIDPSVTTTTVTETTPPSTSEAGPTPDDTTTTTTPASDTFLEGHDLTAKESPEFPESGEPAFLESVSVETDDAATRVLFELDMDTQPSFRVEYAEDPLTASPSGKEVNLAGNAQLTVTLSPTAGVDLSGEEPVETFTGEDRFSPESSDLVREVAETEDFESVVTWAIGLEQPAPFAVGFDESHLVVEFLTAPTPTASATLGTAGNGVAITAALTEGGTCAAVEGHEVSTSICDPVPDDEALQLRVLEFNDHEYLVGFTSVPEVSDVDLIANDGSAIAEDLEGFDLVEVSESLRGFLADSAPMFYSSAVAYDADGDEITRRSVP